MRVMNLISANPEIRINEERVKHFTIVNTYTRKLTNTEMYFEYHTSLFYEICTLVHRKLILKNRILFYEIM